MTSPNESSLCPGCFSDKGNANPCPHCGFDEAAPRPPNALAPRTLLNGQFIIGRVLGRPGGFGITYLGFDRHLQTTVAIKEYLPRDLAVRGTDASTILPQSAEEGDLFRYGLTQFLAEARILAQLNHPNIVRVRQFFEANRSAYLVMDYYRGRSLGEYLERLAQKGPDGRVPERQALALMQPILDGLRAVHAKGFLHRDIKPQNIYLARTDSGGVNPILLDFGAARQAMGERSRSLSVVLSGGYAPFEQYSRKGRQGPWTDVYAAAAVLYRMLTGLTPPEATERVEEDELKPATDFGISQPVSDAIARAMSMDSAARPQTVQAFQRMLVATLSTPAPSTPPRPAVSVGSAGNGNSEQWDLQLPEHRRHEPMPARPARDKAPTTFNPYTPPAADLAVRAQGGAAATRSAHIAHEFSVKAIGLFYYLTGGLLCLGGIVALIATVGSNFSDGEAAGMATVYLILGLPLLWFGARLRNLTRWVRIPVGILSAIGLLGFPLGTLLNGYFLYLLFSKKGDMVFSDEYKAVIAATPGMKHKTPVYVWIVLGVLLLALIVGIANAAPS